MSMMGQLTLFLDIQVKQMTQDTFVHQAKYTNDLMKKFNMDELKPVSTPMSTAKVLDLDENGKAVNQREYVSMIGSLLYLTVTRADIQFVVCLCACFQASPCNSHWQVIQRIFSISNAKSKLGFGTLLLQLILLGFPMVILPGVELIEKALLVLVTFLDLLLFVGLLANKLILHNEKPSGPLLGLIMMSH
jgi:hypothetical protein